MPFNRLSTSKIAKVIGCHPNTVRYYEQIGFIAPVPRNPKGYRLYTEAHLDQMRLARTAMEGAWPGPNIRRSAVALIRCSAAQDYSAVLEQARKHMAIVLSEREQAEAAADFLEQWAQGDYQERGTIALQTSQAAQLVNITVDALRNWERNGLITVPRNPANRYRRYGAAEIGRLRVIRLLRQVGYSPVAILRMLTQFDQGVNTTNLRQVLDTPRPDEDVYMAADRWLTTLSEQEQRALQLIAIAEEMVKKYV